jgi:hypothetical protein
LAKNSIVHDFAGNVSELDHPTLIVLRRKYFGPDLEVFSFFAWLISLTSLIEDFFLQKLAVQLIDFFETKDALVASFFFLATLVSVLLTRFVNLKFDSLKQVLLQSWIWFEFFPGL